VVLALVVLAQVLAGVGTPEIAKLIEPVGAMAPVEPVTVAVNTSEPPRVGVEEVVIATTGVRGATAVVLAEDVAPTAL
jgi:hypothetical protein